MSKERPILFSTPMVQATVEGRKTKNRRVKGLEIINEMPDDWKFIDVLVGSYKDKATEVFRFVNSKKVPVNVACPYGQPGDRLWVRESYGIMQPTHATSGGVNIDPFFVYKADHGNSEPKWDEGDCVFSKWKPSIHMPKSACRIFLEVVSVKVERLQDISEQDAIAEGIEIKTYLGTKDNPCSFKDYNKHSDGSGCPALYSFQSLWQSINGADSWNANPFVWVIEFLKLTQSELNHQTNTENLT